MHSTGLKSVIKPLYVQTYVLYVNTVHLHSTHTKHTKTSLYGLIKNQPHNNPNAMADKINTDCVLFVTV